MGNWAATALLLAVASGSAPAADGWLIRARYQMGTIWTIQARGPGVETAVEAAFDEIDRIERLLSTYRSDSEISRVNRQAGRAFVKVSPETSGLLRRSLAYARESGGAFDPTVGPLVRAWGFKHRDYRVPTPSALARARRSVGYRRVEMDAVRGIRLARQGMELDLGAIGKGYAVDRALAVLGRGGAVAARVDAGGNQGVFGEPPEGGTWKFGIKHPREEGKVLGVTAPGIGGISTSGDAERGFWRYGVRYGHILDPRTGEPARDTLSVTVACRKAEEADALSTTLYVLGPDRGLGLLQAHPGCHAVFVRTADQPGEFRLIESPGFAWADAPR